MKQVFQISILALLIYLVSAQSPGYWQINYMMTALALSTTLLPVALWRWSNRLAGVKPHHDPDFATLENRIRLLESKVDVTPRINDHAQRIKSLESRLESS